MQNNPPNGLYVHVPFCRGRCHYCGFYSVASPTWKSLYLDALEREVSERAPGLPALADTLYIGGGTPSSLTPRELERIVEAVERMFTLPPEVERTLEVNPEDITRENLDAWYTLRFNRLSIGLQSFSDDRLRAVGRRHTARQAVEGTRLAVAAGFDNISIDLIIGLPGQTNEEARCDLNALLALPTCHVSVYLLSVDPGSLFAVQARRRELPLADDEELIERFAQVSDGLQAAGFEHYEISSFARAGQHSRHNSAYWQGGHYAGFGPAAHSHDGRSRRWNVAHVKRYAEAVLSGHACFEEETLTDTDHYNERVMTSLRTSTGISWNFLKECFPGPVERTRSAWERLIAAGHLSWSGDYLRMKEHSWLISDALVVDLFDVPQNGKKKVPLAVTS